MKTKHILLLILCVFVLTACPHTIVRKSSNDLVKPTIKLHVTGNPKMLTIKESLGNGRCPPPRSASGCIAVGYRDTAVITFELKTSPDWHFTEFKICAGTKDNQDCDLDEWEMNEFFAADSTASKLIFPDENGEIDLKQLSSSLTKFYLFDFNSEEQNFYYTIEVCKGEMCISTIDPDIENKGRN